MDQLLGLAGDCGDDCGMAVPQCAHGDTGKHVEVLVASVVPKAAACALNEQCGEPGIGPHQVFVVGRFDVVVLEHFFF